MTIIPQALATYGKTVLWAQLLTNAESATDGEWFAVLGWHPLTIQLDGITTATVQVRGSNQKAAPANSSDEFQLGADVSTNSLLALDAPVKWIKIKVTSWTAGTLNAYMMASPQG